MVKNLLKEVKVKCPYCKKYIGTLLNKEINESILKLYVSGVYTYPHFEKSNLKVEYDCPKCFHKIADNEEDAIKFLKTGKI
jgi:hypothetical protein